MKKFLRIALIFVSFFSVAPLVFAGYLEDVASGTTTPPPATSAPEANKPAEPVIEKLPACVKSYGPIAFDGARNPGTWYMFNMIGKPHTLMAFIFPHAAKEAGCIVLTSYTNSDAAYALQAQVHTEISNDINLPKNVALGMVPIFGSLLQRNDGERGMKKKWFSVAKTTLTLVDRKTMAPIAMVEAEATVDDSNKGRSLLLTNPSEMIDVAFREDLSVQVVAASLSIAFAKLQPSLEKINLATAPHTLMNDAKK